MKVARCKGLSDTSRHAAVSVTLLKVLSKLVGFNQA
jgi:hypothetical protein